MSSNEKEHLNSSLQLPEFNFGEWQSLFEKDPQAFEEKRREWMKKIIQSAPQDYQKRLEGLLFQIDVARGRSNNPIQSCLEISKMMWNSTADLKYFLQELSCLLRDPEMVEEREKQSADILEFSR